MPFPCEQQTLFAAKKVALGKIQLSNYIKQECIPVGCVPPAAVVVEGGGGSASLHARIHTPLQVWA